MNTYRVTGERPVLGNEPGETFEHEFESAAAEAAYVDSGRITIEPREYRVVGPRVVHETAPGETFTRALPMHEELALVEAGHIERVEEKPPRPKRPRSSTPKTRRRRAASTTTKRKEQ
jgi:hypothetical protein